MKVYAVCAVDCYYPCGPESDILSVHLTLEGAEEALAEHQRLARGYTSDERRDENGVLHYKHDDEYIHEFEVTPT